MVQRLVDLGDSVAAVTLIAVFSAPTYAILSLPGIAICAVVMRWLPGPFWPRTLTISTLVVGLFSPVLVPSHSPLILPLPFELWLALHMGNIEAARNGLVWAVGGFVVITVVLCRFWRREQAGVPARGRMERLWRRGRPTKGCS